MASEAIIGYGTVFATGDGNSPEAFTAFGEVASVKMPNASVDTIDRSHELPPGSSRTSLPGMLDWGEAQITFNFIPTSASTLALFAELASKPIKHRRITFPNGSILNFSGYLTGLESTASVGDKISGTATFKVTGDVALT